MPLSLIMDIVISVLLCATIFYAVKLSKHLDAFRSNRADMERLIRDLSSQITRAQEGITTLDDLAKESSDELRGLIAKATGMSDELQIITEAGNNIAERLEGLATKNRAIADEMGQTAVHLTYPKGKPAELVADSKSDSKKSNEESVASMLKPFFSIRDPDFMPELDANDEIDEDDNSFATESERELAQALRHRKNKSEK